MGQIVIWVIGFELARLKVIENNAAIFLTVIYYHFIHYCIKNKT